MNSGMRRFVIGGTSDPGAESDAKPASDAGLEGTGIAEKLELKRPQSVLVVICTRGGEYLLLRRTRPAGFWQSVTGSLSPGETPRHAAARELREETGLLAGGALIDMRHSTLFPIIRPWRKRYGPNICFNREYCFALVLDGRRCVRLNSREHQEYRWLSAREASRLTGSWTNRDAILALDGALR
nr:dihydroneopterin triphosphate diphosphatase [Thiorhodococcus drewsii]